MIVTLMSTDIHRKRLRISVLGADVTTVEEGRGEQTKSFGSRDAAVASVDKSITRRTSKGRWRVLGRTDESHYLEGLARLTSLARQTKSAKGFTRTRAYVQRWGAASVESLDGLPRTPELDGYRDFRLTRAAVSLHVKLEVGPAAQELRFALGSATSSEVHGGSWVGRVNELVGVLDPSSAAVRVFDEESVVDEYPSFRAYFDGMLRELPQHVYDVGHALGVPVHLL